MTRIDLPYPDALTGWQRAQYDRFPSNLTRALLVLGDERLAGALPGTANALRSAALRPDWREAIILRVAARQHSAYERFQHLGQARGYGWSDVQIDAIETGADDELPAPLRPVLAFTDAVVAGPAADDATFQAARAVLADHELLTVLVLIGHYLTVARIIAVLDVELDPAPDSWTNEH